jgi:hypothetical protein
LSKISFICNQNFPISPPTYNIKNTFKKGNLEIFFKNLKISFDAGTNLCFSKPKKLTYKIIKITRIEL